MIDAPHEPLWDFFISHASADKSLVAKPLYTSLLQAGKKVWLDSDQIHAGDSISIKILEGLENSRYGVVILSESFFDSQWAIKELQTLISLEGSSQKRIIPLWHGVDYRRVEKFSRVLADRLAPRTSDGIDHVAAQVLAATCGNPITQLNIESVLDELLPRRNKRIAGDTYFDRGEAYDELLLDLEFFNILDVDALIRIINASLSKILNLDATKSEQSIASAYEFETLGFGPHGPRDQRQVFLGHVDIARLALGYQFGYSEWASKGHAFFSPWRSIDQTRMSDE